MPIKKKKHWIVMRNDLAQTYGPLTLEEQKALYIIFDAIRAGNNSLLAFDEKECVISISKNEFFEILGLGAKSHNKGNTGKKIICGLSSKTGPSLSLQNNDTFLIEHVNGESRKKNFEVHLNPKDMVYLNNLISNYTVQDLTQIMEMKSKFSVILFRKLCSGNNKKNKNILFTLEELKIMGGLKETDYVYEGKFRMSDFENKTIKKAVKEINDLTKMSVAFTKIKEEKVSYKFVYKNKCSDEIPDGLSFLKT